MFYYVYILQSQKNESLYIGHTSDLRKRLSENNSGKSQAGKLYLPYKLIFYEAFLNIADAKNIKTYLKGGYGRRTINSMIKIFLKKTNGFPR